MTSHSHSHSHAHSHHGHHSHGAPNEFKGAFLISITANLIYVLIQVAYAFIAHSNSLLADAGHNFGDVLGLLFAFFASLLLKKQPSHQFSYGFKKTSILASMFNSLLLTFTCAGIAIDAVVKLLNPSPVGALAVSLVAFIGILINGGSALLFMRGREHDLNIRSAFLHLASDALVSLGVVFGGILIYFTHANWLDPVIGLVIVTIVLVSAWGLLKDSVNLVLDGVPTHIKIEELFDFFKSIEGVEAIHDLHVWAMSTKETALTAHLIMPTGLTLTAEKRAWIDHELEERFRIHHTTLQIESEECAHGCN
ncbi:MAG: cation transporter [Gammaproteobacteria bacterium]|nr:cation transporter [Gammaproteobacteria bacterium]